MKQANFSLFVLHSSLTESRHFHLINDAAYDFLACHIACLSLVRKADTVAHYVMSHSSYILWNHIAAMLDKRIGSGCLGKRDAGTRTAAEGNHVFQFAQSIALRITRSKDNIGNILLNLLIEINLVYYLASLQNLPS